MYYFILTMNLLTVPAVTTKQIAMKRKYAKTTKKPTPK